MRKVLLVVLFIALFVGGALAAEYHPNSVLVVLDAPSGIDVDSVAFEDALMTQANSVAAVVGARVVNTYPAIAIETDRNIVHLRSETKSAEQLVSELESAPGVLNVSLNYIQTTSGIICDPSPRFPNDKYYRDNYLWAIKDFGLVRRNNNEKKVAMWDFFTGDGSAVVAIIDTGVAYDHPDLAGVMKKDSYGRYGRHFHSNGQISEEQHPTKRKTDTHGTHVAGIVGAIGNNQVGVVGACWNVGLLAVNVFTGESAFVADVIGGIGYVLNEKRKGMNIRVANMSLGGWNRPADMPDNGAYGTAIRAMTDAGITVVVAAGNDAQDMDNPTGKFVGKKPYPASFNFTNVFCVGAVGFYGARSSYSNYGTRIDVWAPGGNARDDGGMKKTILSTIPLEAKSEYFGTKGYDYMQGTSMASPLVAGYIALLAMGQRSVGQSDKDIAKEIYEAIMAALEDDDGDGDFMLNLYKAMVILNGGEYPFAPLLPTPVTEPTPTSTGSSGGCEVGFGAIAIFAVATLAIKRRKQQ